MAEFAVYTSQYGPVRVDWNDGAVTGLRIVTQADNAADGPGEPTELTDLAFHELERYFAGNLRQFTVPIAFTYGTPFQQAVWRALLQIPYGETRTYAQIAEAVGRPKAVRAVGSANNRNPILFIVPCHRVIGANGNLVGYAYGVEMKRTLLQLEQRVAQAGARVSAWWLERSGVPAQATFCSCVPRLWPIQQIPAPPPPHKSMFRPLTASCAPDARAVHVSPPI